MLVIPVIDIRNGIAVHAVAGDRQWYKPLTSRLVKSIEPARVLEELATSCSFDLCYVADLDAIEGRGLNRCTLAEMSRVGVPLLVDAGAVSGPQAEELLDLGVSTVVIPSESIRQLDSLSSWTSRFSASQLCGSVDLKYGRILTQDPAWLDRSAVDLAEYFSTQGFCQLIVLDLAAVGTGAGVPTLEACRLIKRRCPDLRIITGGGVHSMGCLADAERFPVDGILVGSALHDGRLPVTALKEKFRS